LSTIFDNHQQLPQWVEHDPVEEQQCCSAAGQPIKNLYPSIPFPKPRFAWQLDGLHQRDVSKYLEDAISSKYKDKISSKKFEMVYRKLTLQLFTS
jgi:hypothetical protein